MANYQIVNRLQLGAHSQAAERARLLAGLHASQAHIEPKYFYDELGCALYAAICQLDEYYPTRTERAIFQANRSDIADALGARGAVDTFVDLGAGDCCKAQAWLPIIAPKRYLAIDIAVASLDSALAKMADEFPEIEMTGLATDFSTSLEISRDLLVGRTVFFYPGSSIGNFSPAEAVRFMRQIRGLANGGLLIGVDAKKEKATLDAAYADALGVTAAFNLNALRHINRILPADFVEENWQHVGSYNEAMGRVEMHLQARRAQRVMLSGVPREFALGERIHSENSHKYTRAEFESLLSQAGFESIQCWTDAANAFWVFYAQ